MKKGTAIGIGLLALAGVGAYLYHRYQKAKWEAELPGGFAMPPTYYEESLAASYGVSLDLVRQLIESIPETESGPPPEVVAEKILQQEGVREVPSYTYTPVPQIPEIPVEVRRLFRE